MERIRYGMKDRSFSVFLSCITTAPLSSSCIYLKRSIKLVWLLALQVGWATSAPLADTEYMYALLRAQPFWIHIISAIANPEYLQDKGTSGHIPKNLFEDIIRLISVCLSYTSQLAHDRQGGGNTTICEDYMKVLVRADIFYAMERVLLSKMETHDIVAGEWDDRLFYAIGCIAHVLHWLNPV